MKSSKPSAITAAPSSSIGAGLAGSGRHHHGAHSLDAHCPKAPADLPPGRFVADSPLEGDGFEPSVPGRHTASHSNDK